MVVKFLKQCLSFVLSSYLLSTTMPAGFADQGAEPASQTPVQAAQQTPEQLQQLVAPIALYPAALVSQVLAASTYPPPLLQPTPSLPQTPKLHAANLGHEV